jgi:glycosyltransferase involved in cell wall biosynthesis
MNILVATPWFPNTPEGWPGRFVSDSALALARAGAQVRVDCFRGWTPPGFARFSSPAHTGDIDRAAFGELAHLDVTRHLAFPGELMRPLKNLLLDRAVIDRLEGAIVGMRPDVLLVHTESLAFAAVGVAKRHDLPVVVILHGRNTNLRYTDAPGQARRFREALSQADRLVIVGEPLRFHAEKLSGRADHIVTVWNGVAAPPWRRSTPAPDDAPVQFVTVANLQEGKGVDLLIEACARLIASGVEGWRLTIVGDGPQRGALDRQVAARGLGEKVSFAGAMSNSGVFEQLGRSDVFVLPSYREAFGVAYLEAMASGLLAIGVEGQGPSQFIAHGRTGVLIKPRDAVAVEAALREVLSDDSRGWRAIAAAGARHVRENCGWDAHAKKLLGVFEAVRSPDGRRAA